MGKSKKTRWRTFSFDGSKDETQINGDVKVDGTTDLNTSSLSSQKYSHIIGDHQDSNYLPHIKSTGNHNNFKTRNYNKENHYNQQRSAAKNNLASKNSWQRNSNSSAFRSSVASLKDCSNNNNKSEENGKTELSSSDSNCKQECFNSTEPIKFNEDEYTRITTPRQDVLFKKGYLSRMNSNKTVNNNSSSVIVDSTSPNSTTTNSDPESSLSVSTLSPATTPSMDFGQVDSQDYANTAPVYYPGYFDESGMLVFPMYNGYNYYPPNGSTSPPVFLMPYPYQYDPFFMAPNTEVPLVDDNNSDELKSQQNGNNDREETEQEKASSCNDEKENNPTAEEEQNHVDADNETKEVKEEQNEIILNEPNEQTPKQCYPIYANELGYVYPYANGFYNGFYYYNGIPSSSSRPPKGKRRKRYSSSRSSNSHPAPPRSTAETTTDYSDDDGSNSTHNRRYYSRYNHHHSNGWNYHNSHRYNQYHYNSKYHHYQKSHADQNANQVPSMATTNVAEKEPIHHESNLNVNVVEFYPRVHSNDITNQQQSLPSKEQESKCNAKENDLEKSQQVAKSRSDASQKSTNNNNNLKPSQTLKSVNRVSKKEIMDGIKLMEQQNINLKATSKAQLKTATSSFDADVEWNVIKKGKKVKVVKDSQGSDYRNKNEPVIDVINKSSTSENIKSTEVVAVETTSLLSQETVSNKKTLPSFAAATPSQHVSVTNTKSKKSKNKNKKKKPFSMTKQDGFKIIEPDFSGNSNEKVTDEIINETSDEEDETTVVEEEEEKMSEIINDNNAIKCEQKEISNEPDQVNENVIIVERQLVIDVEKDMKLEKKKQQKEDVEEIKLTSDESKVQEEILKVFNVELSKTPAVDDNDAIIDISDEEICRKTSIEIDLSIAQEIAKIESETIIVEPKITKEEKIITETASQEVKNEEESLFEDSNYFNDRKNIAELERDLIENLKSLDIDFDIKSPTINPLFDFPITSAVRKWLQEKQNESFDNLFRVENFKKLSELYDDCEDEDDDDESDISDSPQKSETTDSDYASDIQVKLNGSPASSNAKLDTKLASKCNNKLIVKESFCALM